MEDELTMEDGLLGDLLGIAILATAAGLFFKTAGKAMDMAKVPKGDIKWF